MSRKNIVLRNENYPENCSCHVRDPKVWSENGRWNMVLGARTLYDKGCVLFYQSDDLENWNYVREDAVDDFGYMWECPDFFKIDGHGYLSLSPQGLIHTDTENQNVYSSGYFEYDKKLEQFTEWDKGFDFYAPQTFETPDGRRILIGWMGIGDIPYCNPTTALGYQHCLTLPREISRDADGTLRQNPVAEISSLRDMNRQIHVTKSAPVYTKLPFDMISKVDSEFAITIDDAIELSLNESLFTLKFTDSDVSGKRDIRRAKLNKCENIRIIADKSSLEIYLDDGRVVLSTRMYPKHENVKISVNGLEPVIYPLNGMEVKYSGE